MPGPDASLLAIVGRLIDVLEPSGASYAFGGAIALAAWSEPRATADIDVILWIDPLSVDRAIDLVSQAGVAVERDVAQLAARDRGLFVGHAGSVRVDVFVPSIPFYDEAERRRVRTVIAERSTWIHSAEVLAVFKMLFFRPKDLVDVERMLEVRGADFDRGFVRDSLIAMLGDDERIARWDVACAKVTAGT